MASDLEKIKSQTLVGSPLETDDLDFDFGKKEFNRKQYLKYREPSLLIHSFTGQLGLYKAVGDHFFVFDDSKKTILYAVKYSIISFLGYRFVVQKQIWRSPALTQKLEGMSIPTYVFFRHLLPLADGVGIVTGAMQTASGKRFWFDRVAQAFEQKLNVYLMDQINKTKIKIRNFDDFESKIEEEKTWNSGLTRRVVLSKENFSVKNPPF